MTSALGVRTRPSLTDSDDDIFYHVTSAHDVIDSGGGRPGSSDLDDVTEGGPSIVEGLLEEIYERWQYQPQRDSVDSDTFTETSSVSEVCACAREVAQDVWGHAHSRTAARRMQLTALTGKEVEDLRVLVGDLQRQVAQVSAQLVRQLKRKDRRLATVRKNNDIVTAVLQAASLKRREDARMRFSVEPLPGDEAFQQWKDGMKAVARLPQGIPAEFRRTVWLSLADRHIAGTKLDWDKTKRFAFNERSNPDDNKLGLQIVKDLHRTGCSGFSGHEQEEDRAVLKRVLLAYARWNKEVGYCQGFNVLAALILDVMGRNEENALKVMMMLIDGVLPDSYFANNLRALSVDMAAFRDLLRLRLPALAKHLDQLQAAAKETVTGANYEPPLTNVFTMQWFLTLFATCLPKATALRVWDSVILEGSEVLLRVAVAIWAKLQSRMMAVGSADEFYCTMGHVTQEMLEGASVDADTLLKEVYLMGEFPLPQLQELRDKYAYNITPFSAAMATGGRRVVQRGIFSDPDEEMDEDDLIDSIHCFSGIMPGAPGGARHPQKLGDLDRSSSEYDISKVSAGAYAAQSEDFSARVPAAYAERMTTDVHALRRQYRRLMERQKQAHVIMAAAQAKHNAKLSAAKPGPSRAPDVSHVTRRASAGPSHVIPPAAVVAPIETSPVVNHLFVGRREAHRTHNRTVVDAPRIAPMFPSSALIGPQLDASGKVPRVRSQSVRARESESSVATTDDASSEKGDVTEKARDVIEEGTLAHATSACDLAENEAPEGEGLPRSQSVPIIVNNNNKVKVDDEELQGKTDVVVPHVDVESKPTLLQLAQGHVTTATDGDKQTENIARLAIKTHKMRTDVADPNSVSDNKRTKTQTKVPFMMPKSTLTQRRLEHGIKLGLYKPEDVQLISKPGSDVTGQRRRVSAKR